MAVQGTFYTGRINRIGSSPVSPPILEGDAQNPVNPPGSGSLHNPVTIGTPSNGLSITAGQELSLALASSGVTGALSGSDWDTFNGKIGGSIASGQVAFGTGSDVIGGSNNLTYSNGERLFSIINSDSSPERGIRIDQYGSNIAGASFAVRKARGSSSSRLPVQQGDLIGSMIFNAYVGSSYTVDRSFISGFMSSASGQSLAIIAGTTNSNYAPVLLIHESGNVGIGLGGSIVSSVTAPTSKLDVNGTTRIRTINNLGTTASRFLVADATGVVSERTASEVASDIGAVLTTTDQSIAGVKTFTGQVSVTGTFLSLPTALSDRGKLRIFGASSEWAIGNQGSTTFGRLNNTAITFNVPNTDTQGWWWGDTSHSTSQGAMALTSNGNLTVANSLRIGYGESDTDDTVDYDLDHNGTVRFAGIPSGTIVDSLGLDSNNQVVKGSSASVSSGTFTPTLVDNGSGATYTLGGASGNYYKIGNMVNVYITIQVTSTSGTPSGELQIGNLPFSINYSLDARIVQFGGSGLSDSDLSLIEPFFNSGVLRFKYRNDTLTYLDAMTLTTTGLIIITGSYIAT